MAATATTSDIMFTGATRSRKKSGPNAKPSSSSRASKSRRQTFLFMATMLVAATLFTIAISGRRHKLMRRKEEKEVKQGGPVLDEALCHNADKLQVCSHQILTAPVVGLLRRSPPPDGSMQAMESLWKAGIRCFDIDIVTLKDGTHLVSHPSRFAAAIGERRPEQDTLDEARADGADAIGFPILQDILEKFASLVKKDGEGAYYATQNNGMIPPLEGPLLNMDLKGPNLSLQHLQQVEQAIKQLGINDNVVICATALEEGEIGPGIDILQIMGGDSEKEHKTQLQLGLVLRDLVEKDKDTARIQSLLTKYTAIKLFVPSNKFDLSFFGSIASFSFPVTSWTVDNQEGLVHAITGGLSAIISNDPLKLSEMHERIRRRCQI